MRRRRRSTGSYSPWCLEASHRSSTTALLTQGSDHIGICECLGIRPLLLLRNDAVRGIFTGILSYSSSFLSSSRRLLQCASPAGSGAGESSLGLSSLCPSPQTSSATYSPCALSNGPETQSWDPDSNGKYISRKTALADRSVPSPAALQDTSSQDTQSSGVHSGMSSFYKNKKFSVDKKRASDIYAIYYVVVLLSLITKISSLPHAFSL